MSNLPPNQYFGKMVNAALGAIGQNETPAMVLTMEITHAAFNGEWQMIDVTKRDVQFYLTENAKARSFADLVSLGFNGDFDAPAFSDTELTEGIELTVINEYYKDKLQDKISITKLKAGGRELKPVAVDLKRSLAAQFKTAAGASARPSTPPPARPAAAPAATATAAAAPSRPTATATRPTMPAVGGAGSDEPPFARLGEFELG